jgi:hypothetical protein
VSWNEQVLLPVKVTLHVPSRGDSFNGNPFGPMSESNIKTEVDLHNLKDCQQEGLVILWLGGGAVSSARYPTARVGHGYGVAHYATGTRLQGMF